MSRWFPRSRHQGYIDPEAEVFCPACLVRDAINSVGQPRRRHGFLLTGGCEECGGSGRLVVRLAKIPGFRPRTAIPGRN
jgi:hypothetical protein